MQIFFQSLSLFPQPHEWIVRKVAKAGFDGIEIVLLNSAKWRSNAIRSMCEEAGLKLHWHQPWSLAENCTHFHNRVLHWSRLLPREGYTLEDCLRGVRIDEPLVCYIGRWEEAILLSEYSLWFQTAPTFKPWTDAYDTSYREGVRFVAQHDLPVVFDTQHVLEWYLKVRGVEKLPCDREELLDLLIACWEELGPYVKEIHFNDCDPRLGHNEGRNLFPGNGIMPLREFSAEIRKEGWGGILVPEVQPKYLKGRGQLQRLNKTVRIIYNGDYP